MEINKNFPYNFIVLLIGLVISLPILIIFLNIFELSVNDIIDFVSTNFSNYLNQTFILIFLTSLYSLIFAVIPAFLVSFFNIKYRELIDLFLILPLSIPCYILAFTYSDVLGFNGTLYNFLNLFFNFNYDVLNINWLSIFLALSLYPYIYVSSRISFSLIGSTYINLSKSLNLSKYSIISKVILPLSFSGILSGLTLVIMEILNEYGAVKYFGIETFSVGIFKYWFSLDEKNISIFLSSILIIIVIVLMIFSNYISKREEKVRYHIKSNSSYYLFDKLKFNILIYFFILMPFFLGFFLPLFFIIINVIKNFNFYDFKELFGLVSNSLSLGIFSSLLIVFISFYLLNIKRILNTKYIKFIVKFITTGYAIPGAVIGFSIMMAIRYFDSQLTFLMGSIYLLIYAYIFRFISVAIFPIQSSLERQPKIFDKQAKSLNATYLKIFRSITFPLNKHALFSAFILVFIDIIKELPITLILRPFNFDTLATQTYIYASEEKLGFSSLFSLIIILCCSIMLIYVTTILNKKNVPRG